MRNLVLLLVLANLGLLGWQHWIAPDGKDTSFRGDREELPPLILAPKPGKAPPAPDTAGTPAGEASQVAEVAPTVTTPANGAPRCVSTGPFRDLSEAGEAMNALRSAGYAPRQRLTEGQVWVGHWVYLPAFPSRAEARTILNALKRRGVADSYIVPSGPERNAVSLGVFAERERAERRVVEVSALGYAPRIADRHRIGAVYWVDTELDAGGALDVQQLASVPGRIMRLEIQDCP
ncbi:MAG TPA: SPOR domain-containing protein [Gammaproteobacteria bacterium]|nr:SPOR domain-containing protein [Gammaproteobacteria bacterium]